MEELLLYRSVITKAVIELDALHRMLPVPLLGCWGSALCKQEQELFAYQAANQLLSQIGKTP